MCSGIRLLARLVRGADGMVLVGVGRKLMLLLQLPSVPEVTLVLPLWTDADYCSHGCFCWISWVKVSQLSFQ